MYIGCYFEIIFNFSNEYGIKLRIQTKISKQVKVDHFNKPNMYIDIPIFLTYFESALLNIDFKFDYIYDAANIITNNLSNIELILHYLKYDGCLIVKFYV